MELTVENKDVEGFLKVDKDLDQFIFECSRNEFATKATAPLHIRSRRFWYHFKGLEDLENCADVHIKLIDAIISSDEEKAVQISTEIIDGLVEVVKKIHKYITLFEYFILRTLP